MACPVASRRSPCSLRWTTAIERSVAPSTLCLRPHENNTYRYVFEYVLRYGRRAGESSGRARADSWHGIEEALDRRGGEAFLANGAWGAAHEPVGVAKDELLADCLEAESFIEADVDCLVGLQVGELPGGVHLGAEPDHQG